MSIQETIKALIQSAVGADVPLVLEHPADLAHGDYSCNIAMQQARVVGKNPRELAEEMVSKIPEHPSIAKVEVAGPGFVNFYLSEAYLAEQVAAVLERGDSWGSGGLHSGKKILIEKSAPNLFKPFHVGHLLNISIGESLSRITKFAGAEVVDVAYPSDISLGVAKALWWLRHGQYEEEMTVNFLGRAYVEGTKAYEDDESAKAAILEINKQLNEDSSTVPEYAPGRALNLEYFKSITARLGSVFDGYFFESESGKVGKELILADTKGVFTESDGAIVFKGEEYGLHTRVFITSLGLPVYEAKDIGLITLKFEQYNPDVSIVITDVEQKQYFEVIKKAAELFYGSWGERSLYLQHGRLRFAGGKVSSRYGNVPLAEDMLEQVKALVQGESDAVREQVALAAIKYSFLRVSTGKNIVFDFEQSISVEGDSGPYLQYTYARCKSVLAKAGTTKYGHPALVSPSVERLLYRFSEVVERAALEFEPHYVAEYLNALASAYNSWYAREQILDGSDAQGAKLALTAAVAQTLKNGLHLLGIDAPERM